MPDLALSDSLIDEYLKYKFQNDYNPTTIRKLFKYIQSFGLQENHYLMQDPAISKDIGSDPLIEITDIDNDYELVQSTVLKLKLVDKVINPSPVYRTINILNDYEKLKPKYGATYTSTLDKNKAQQHIKALLSDAKWIQITDAYIATSKWDDNKDLLAKIIPNKNIDLTIVGADKGKKPRRMKINENEKNEFKKLLPNLRKVKATELTPNIHDRYIETDTLKILLSSGLEHLSSKSSKDFTYIIEIK